MNEQALMIALVGMGGVMLFLYLLGEVMQLLKFLFAEKAPVRTTRSIRDDAAVAAALVYAVSHTRGGKK